MNTMATTATSRNSDGAMSNMVQTSMIQEKTGYVRAGTAQAAPVVPDVVPEEAGLWGSFWAAG
jgi:hypothetical protein